jgi:hypothetical protein
MALNILERFGSYENFYNYNVVLYAKYRDKIDGGIQHFIKDLNDKGIYSVFSCSGHREGFSAYVTFATFITQEQILTYLNTYHSTLRIEDDCRLKQETNGQGVTYFKLVIFQEGKTKLGIKSLPKPKKFKPIPGYIDEPIPIEQDTSFEKVIQVRTLGDGSSKRCTIVFKYPNSGYEQVLYHADPDCEHEIVGGDNMSGIKCRKCGGWYCA